jgi:hypothetical protein
MIKYEYNAINNPQFLGDRLLNRLGENGWELVSHAYNSNTCDHFYTFKREKMEVIPSLSDEEVMEMFQKEYESPGWVDPMMEMLDKEEESYKDSKKALKNYTESLLKLYERGEERAERELIKEILSDPRNADGFADEKHKQPRYVYEGYTYILNLDLNRIIGVEVPREVVERKWLIDDLKEKDEVVRKFKLDDSFKKALEEAVVSDTPASSSIDEYRESYDKLLASGMFWEFYPTFTGEWDKDKYAFCYDRKYKKK